MPLKEDVLQEKAHFLGGSDQIFQLWQISEKGGRDFEACAYYPQLQRPGVPNRDQGVQPQVKSFSKLLCANLRFSSDFSSFTVFFIISLLAPVIQ